MSAAIVFRLRIYLSEEFYLIFIEVFAYTFHHPDIAEELRSEVSISHYGFFYHTQVGIDEFDNLVVGRYSFRCHLVQLVRQAFQFGFYNSVINVVLAFKVGV